MTLTRDRPLARWWTALAPVQTGDMTQPTADPIAANATTSQSRPRLRVALAPLAAAQRSLAPDIARGLMLLFIALANVPGYLYGRPLDDTGAIEGTSGLSRVAHGVILLLVENRSRPMFAILYGFGLAMIATRLMERARAEGVPEEGAMSLARRLVARRSLWLVALGALHAVFLFLGDILGAYGVTGLVVLGIVVASDRTVRRALWLFGVGVSLVGMPILALLFTPTSTGGEDLPSPNGATYLESMMWGGISFSLVVTLAGLFAVFVPLALCGVLLLRAGWITSPSDHVRSLSRVAVGGIAVGVASAAPSLAIAMGWWDASLWQRMLASYVNLMGGTVAGLGYICAFALLAHALRGWGRRGPVRAVAALGERSLTGYLLQSIVCAPLLASWGLNLGEDRGYAFAFAFAVGVWLLTVGVAVLLDRAGRRGPFEVLLRRLTYR